MASSKLTRIPTQVLQADNEAYVALKAISDYQSANPDYSLVTVARLHENVQATLEAELHAQNTLAAARDAALASQRAFHEAILGVKNQVKAFYGADSDQLAALGLKKKSDRKAPTKSGKAAVLED